MKKKDSQRTQSQAQTQDQLREWLRDRFAKTGKPKGELARLWGKDGASVSKFLKGERDIQIHEKEIAESFFGEGDEAGHVSSEDVAASLAEDNPYADQAYSREMYVPKLAGGLPELDQALGAGEGRAGEILALQINGNTYSGHRIAAEWVLPEQFVRTEARASATATVIMPVTGDSMLPSFNYGDRVLVDLSQNAFVHDAVYAISDGDSEPRVKRLQLVFNSSPKRVRILSDNPAYKAEEQPLAEVRIIGRVCGVIARR